MESPIDPDFLPYYNKQYELSIENDVLIWNERVAIPKSLRNLLLNDLHAEHSGMVKMKQLARRYIWWPNIDHDIEMKVRSCYDCQENAKLPAASKPATWSWPAGPWKRLHIDFAGPFQDRMFLIVVDAFSKYLDVIQMKTANTENTITALRRIFSIFGLPEHLVSDNGSQFTSEDFKKFLSNNDIVHTLTAPGHPATNGLAERFVGTFKNAMKKIGNTGESMQCKLDRFLLHYRSTPLSIGKSPSELLLNRQPRIRLSVLRASQAKKNVEVFQDNMGNVCKFKLNQPVFVLNFGRGAK